MYIPFSNEKVICTVYNIGFKWNNFWSFSGIKIKADCDNGEEFRAGFLSNDRIGVIHIYSDHNKDSYKDFQNTASYRWVKLECNRGYVRVFFSKDGTEWIQFWEEKCISKILIKESDTIFGQMKTGLKIGFFKLFSTSLFVHFRTRI